MCGRFTLRTNPHQLALIFGCEIPSDLPASYNVAPTQSVAALRGCEDGQREFTLLRWGLIPHWAKETSIGNRMINARAETIAEKPAFRSAFRQRRCLVLADGYFEWQKMGKSKQPFLIRMCDEAPFAMAGLWESWSDPQQGGTVASCTVITTEANELTRPIHDRMPVILSAESYDLWLNPRQHDHDVLLPLLRPFDSHAMVANPVSPRVNNPRNNDPECVEVVAPAAD
ncbi:MAG: SOS response-associated peptidase [Pirellulaceae bacterium]|nr:SOS response-associated peptidase [Pirellulaceae bacterium]